MDVNLTGQVWGWPFNLAGQIAKRPDQFSIGLIDIIIIFFSIIFIAYVLKKRVIPIFGGFWYHQETRPLSEHEGERFLFQKIGEKFKGYRPTHDRKFWKEYIELYGEILSPLKEELHYEEKLANWMLAISGSALILIAANFDKFQIARYEYKYGSILIYYSPDKFLFIFVLFILFISASLHFAFKLGLFYLEGDLETTRTYIPLPDGITNLESAERSIEDLKRDLNSFNREERLIALPIEYSNLVVRFEGVEKNLDIARANNWRKFQIGNAFFIVGLISLGIFYLLFIFNY
jgi:hypothetical protein